ncbi:MAG: hybrid sensor histidine kinase/response regulator [Anaerolineae bacterium]|nr:hybrid sensor histidine kinase/response regulator [Anaerolineae bacterium]
MSANMPRARAMLDELQAENLLLTVPALLFLSFPLVVAAPHLEDPSRATDPALLAFCVAAAVWAAKGRSPRLAAWLMVVGSIGVDLLVMHNLRLEGAALLLALPAGLAALFIGLRSGVATAVACTVFVAYAPPWLMPAESSFRATVVIGLWATLGLICLALRSSLALVESLWSSYERNCGLLEEARNQRLRLKEALKDLADANVQLQRLNRLATGLRQEAEEARRAKEQFVASVSHELRTPLNMIIGFTETILQAPQVYGPGIPPPLLADLAIVLRNSQHLSSLIDDVLDLSQIEAGRMALTKDWVSLAEISDVAATAVQPLFGSKGLDLEIDLSPDVPLVFCDRTRIREVLLNLLSNAGRFTETGGVRLQVRSEGESILISVADTGPGIAPEDQERLFQPFERLGESVRRRYGGTGLGLAISKRIVELHGGEMWVESEPGQGTTFFLRLPVMPRSPLPASRAAGRWLRPEWEYEQRTRPVAARGSLVRPRLVVLEAGRTLARLLARYGGDVEVVSTERLEEALEELAKTPAQALLVNEPSPELEGRRLRALGCLPHGTPAIVCSVPGREEAASSLGVAEYLVKPVGREALFQAVERLHLRDSTVLVVDDDPETCRLFRRMLHSYGLSMRVLTATSARQALALLREQQPDLLILDLIMPDMDGFALLAEKANDPLICAIPVVVVSANDPSGRPVVTPLLAATRRGGFTITEVLACIQAIGRPAASSGPADPGASLG